MTKAKKNKVKHERAKDILTADLKKIKSALDLTSKDIQKLLHQEYSDSITRLKTKSARIKNNLSAYAIKKPIKSVSIAALIGLLIGFRMAR